MQLRDLDVLFHKRHKLKQYLFNVNLFFSEVNFNMFCYTSQLKYVSWLEENVSRAIGQNSMTP